MDLFELLGKVRIDNADANRALDDTSEKGQQTESKLGKFFSGIGKGALAIGKTIGVGLAAGGAAMGALTVKALNLSGELEQNMGGSEAVFKEYAGKMQETAKTAFSNMGLSTSDFLGTANKMGALFQGAGFSIEESSDLASSAMQRAADVASIMGLDTSAAMEAIAGAAKGNFTMMDNLGVAMNDTTIQAYAAAKGINKTTAEMTNQEKIGLAMEMFMEKTAYAAGNYAKENETLAGSLGTAKAALTNFLDGSGDVESLVTAFSNAANVIVKNVKEIAPRLIKGITDIINQVMPMLPPLLNQLLPVIIEGAVSLIDGLVSALPGIISAIMLALPALIQGVQTIINAVIQALPQIVESIAAALPALIPLLVDGLVSMIVTLCQQFSSIIQPIIDHLPEIIVSIVDALMENLPILIEGLIALVLGIVSSIDEIIQALVDCLPDVIASIITGLLGCLPQLIAGFIQLVAGVAKAASSIWKSVKEAFVNVFKGIWKAITNIFSGAGSWFGKIFKAAKDAVTNAWSSVTKFFSNIWKGITGVFTNIGGWFKNKFTSAKNGVTSAWSGVKNFFSNVKSGIVKAFSNIKDLLTAPFAKARDVIKGIADRIKGFFKGNISMPKIKMPHFSVSPSGWKIGDLLKGSIPKLAVKWYADAMNNPMIMTKPTIFGYNPTTGNLLGGGEVPGGEVVSGAGTLMNMIENAVENKTDALGTRIIALLTALLDAIVNGNQELLQALLSGQKIVLNEREVARTVKKYA